MRKTRRSHPNASNERNWGTSRWIAPNLKKKDKAVRKKAFLTTWSEDEADSKIESLEE